MRDGSGRFGSNSSAPERLVGQPLRFRPDRLTAVAARSVVRRTCIPGSRATRSGSTTTEQLFDAVQVATAAHSTLRIRGRIHLAAADLAARVQVGAVGDAAVVLGDAEHVRGVIERGEVGELGHVLRPGRPDAVIAAMHRDDGRYPVTIVGDVPPDRLAADQLDVARVRRPDGEADRRRLAVRVRACWRPDDGSASGNGARSGRRRVT